MQLLVFVSHPLIENSYMYNSFRAGCSTSTKKVLVFSGRNKVVIFLKTSETITAFFLSWAVHTNAVGLHRSALQPRIADRVGGRIFFCLSSSIFKMLSLMKDIVSNTELES